MGNLVAILTAIKGLPLTYNRDLQEDKEPLFDSIDTLHLALAVNTEMISAMTMRVDHCAAAAADPMLLATDLADYLVKKGVPFRHAHELVGKAVAEAIASKTPLDQLDLTKISEHYGNDTSEIFQLSRALKARTNPGCPNPEIVRQQISRWQAQLA
jgi:argininosuccinate lyase